MLTLTVQQEAELTGMSETDVTASRSAHRTARTWELIQLTGLDAVAAGAPVEYGSPEWLALPVNDPRRAAALIRAAAAWRSSQAERASRFVEQIHAELAVGDAVRDKYFADWEETEQEEWRQIVQDVRAWANHPTAAEHAEMLSVQQVAAARQPVATAGWPPIAIPGKPGLRRHLVDGQQIDLLDREPLSGAA